MRPFHTITVPHKDILEGNLSMDVYAANLWEVYKNRGPEEYKNPVSFFQKTYLTKGLSNLIQIVEKRLNGGGGDAVIQLQTPFGGGKTHSLIALFHKAKEWNTTPFVFVGDKLNPNDTIIWEELEEQITGKIALLKGKTVPSGESIREILSGNQPIIILLDELIEYLIPSRGIKIENTTLDSQILAFIKRLAEVAGSLEKIVLLVTSPSRTQYSEEDQILLNLLNERLGRVEKTFTPVEDYEVTHIVRKRLFSEVNEKKVKDIVYDVVEYFKREDILPLGIEPSVYKDKFIISYPFLPDVIECLFHKWGSFPNFQRTRGVLRFLSLAIYCLREKNIEYITLGDFDLQFQELRRELIKNIGNEFDSIIAADITDPNSGSKKVDNSLGESYKGLHIGTRSSTAIFLYSFSTGRENGANLKEIKRSSALISIPSSIVSEAVDILKNEKLFFIEEQAGKIFFKNTPNLNKIIINKVENVEDKDIIAEEKQFLVSLIKKGSFNKIYIWPTESRDIDDNPNLKLVILNQKNSNFITSIVENKGTIPRVYRNTLFFLSPIETKRMELFSSIKRKIALEQIQKDSSLKLNQQEKKNIADSLKKQKQSILTKINETYRILNIPSKNKIDDVDLGIPTYGDTMNLTKEVYEKLKSEGTIIEKMVPLVVKEKYLKGKDYVSTKNIHDNSLKTLGENRLLNESVLKNSIIDGVKKGLFGLGTIEDDKITPIYWKEKCQVGFSDNEILIIPNICENFFKEEKPGEEEEEEDEQEGEGDEEDNGKKKGSKKIKKEISKINIPKFVLPKGKVSGLLGLLNYIQKNFEKVQIKIEASEGEIDEGEYQDNIKEALKQIGIDIK
ncbi:MAG: ATP-binding protein [Promethearchaeota archaeon]